MFREARLLLIEVDGDNLKLDRCTALKVQQDIEHGVGIFST